MTSRRFEKKKLNKKKRRANTTTKHTSRRLKKLRVGDGGGFGPHRNSEQTTNKNMWKTKRMSKEVGGGLQTVA